MCFHPHPQRMVNSPGGSHMTATKPWRTRAGLALLAVLLVLSAGILVSRVTATPAASAPDGTAATAPAIPGALPESYPWMRLAESLTPAVVNVRTIGETPRTRDRAEEMLPEPFRRHLPPELRGQMPDRPRPVRGIGSGFIIDAGGYIVTNQHVVDSAKSIEVTLSDGRKLPAKLVGSDPETDIALLKVEATGLPTIPLGNSGTLRVAEPVMTIGNPFGLDHTVTVGIISGTGRVIGAGRYDDFLQTDAAINPGNSGGPIINTRGEAVGITSAIASRSGGFQGIGFAIPIDLANAVVDRKSVLQGEGDRRRGAQSG